MCTRCVLSAIAGLLSEDGAEKLISDALIDIRDNNPEAFDMMIDAEHVVIEDGKPSMEIEKFMDDLEDANMHEAVKYVLSSVIQIDESEEGVTGSVH